MVKKEIINTAMEMTKNIPSTDSNVSKNDFDNGTTCDNKENILAPLQSEESNLTPFPRVEYKIIEAPTMDKLVRDVNAHLANGRVCDGGVQVSSGPIARFYQSVERWIVRDNFGPESEMPRKNSEGDTQGPKPLYIPGLEDEPDLYEDAEKDGTTLQRK